MSAKIFFDTNILVYAFDNHDPTKQQKARELINTHGSTGAMVLSTQVLQEFYVVVTGKLKTPISPKDAEDIVSDLATFPLTQINKTLILKAIQRHQQQSHSFWDCLIIEAAIDSKCSILLSEDMQDGFEIGDLLIQNPFT
jgi:predicted nucleic acid-binding protein